MRGLQRIGLGFLCLFTLALAGFAGEFRLANGNTLRGELASTDEDGLVVKLDVGGFSKREPWVNFSQDTLKEIGKDKKLAPLVEPFIELSTEELKAQATKKEIVVRDVPTRLERPAEKVGFLGALLTPVGLAILAVLLAANLYAGYEIALFRQQSTLLVCGLSLVLPVVAPLLFVSLPTRVEHDAEAEGEGEAVAGAGAAGRKTTGVVAGKPSSGLSLASLEKGAAAAGPMQPQTYTRGDHTFNRRFFETKFAGFFRVVPGEAEKDMVLVFKTVKQEYIGRRISRISMNELHLVLLSGNQEASITFAEITTVQVRHKDAKA
jgi:hypothetical protein